MKMNERNVEGESRDEEEREYEIRRQISENTLKKMKVIRKFWRNRIN